jgi:hypothetical protein
MNPKDFEAMRKFVATPSGRISYVERGTGPAALFVRRDDRVERVPMRG